MANQIQRRRGTTLEHQTFTGAVAEMTIDTDKNTGVIHDGVTPGGHPLLREDLANLQGIVSAGRGGTGLDHVPTNAVLVGNGTLPMTVVTPTNANQVLSYDGNAIRWTSANSSNGNVTSVAGKIGVVTLEPADINGLGAMATRTKIDWNTDLINKPATFPSANAVSSVAGKTGAIVLSVQDVIGAASLASPSFTGTPRAPTPTVGDNSTAIATTAWVTTTLASYVPSGGTSSITGMSGDTFTGNGSTSSYTLSGTPFGLAGIMIFVDGIYQPKDTYTWNGLTGIVFSEVPPNGSEINIIWFEGV